MLRQNELLLFDANTLKPPADNCFVQTKETEALNFISFTNKNGMRLQLQFWIILKMLLLQIFIKEREQKDYCKKLVLRLFIKQMKFCVKALMVAVIIQNMALDEQLAVREPAADGGIPFAEHYCARFEPLYR